MPRPIRTFLLAGLLLSWACGGEGDGASSAPEAELRIALLTSGPVSDAGWYAGAYEGLLLLEDSLGAEISHQQTSTPAEFDEAFLAYASSGYDLIFAHGFEYQDAAMRAGEQFPNTTIIVSGGGRFADNVVPSMPRRFSVIWRGARFSRAAHGNARSIRAAEASSNPGASGKCGSTPTTPATWSAPIAS